MMSYPETTPPPPSLFKLIRQQLNQDTPVVRCSKATLVQLSHTIEDVVLSRGIPALFFIGLQEQSQWRQERERYHQLAQVAQQVWVFSVAPVPSPSEANFIQLTLNADDPLRHEWFLVILSEPLALVLCAEDNRLETASDAARQFDVIWSFEPDLVNQGLDFLEEIITAYQPEYLVSLQKTRANYTVIKPNLALIANLMMQMVRLEETLHQRFWEAEGVLKRYQSRLEAQVTQRMSDLLAINQQLQQEIAERREVEVTLAEERNLLRTLIDNLPERIFIKDTESRFVLANQAVLRLMEVPRMEDLLGKTDFDFHPAEVAARYYADEQAVMQSGEPLIGREGGRTTLSGEQRWYLATKVPLRDSQGQIIGLVGLNQDITARKRSEEELQRHRNHLEDLIIERTAELSAANQKLQQEIVERQRAEAEREQLYQQTQKQADQLEQILNAIQAGIILLDNEYRIKVVNSTAQICLSVLTNVDIGQPCTHLGGRPLSEFLSALPPGGYHEVTPEGESRPIFEIKMRPVIAAPKAEGWVLVIRDVTDHRDIQKRAQEQEKLAAVGQLAAGIAHDFNNILTSIIGFAELARYEPNVPVSVQTDLNHVVQQGKRAAHLVRQILDFARKNITSKRPLEFNGFLADMVRLLERTIPETIRLELEIEPAQETYTLNADATQLQQVLTNLAVNAADAMPAGGLLKFRLSRFTLRPGQWPPCPGLSPGDWLVLAVMDTGTGISAKDLPHIFEPFFTTKEVGQGTGLGLAQVDGIIKQHDGHIKVESKVGKGTTFTLYLPLFQPKRSVLFEVNPRTKFSGRGETLLLVEDDPAVLEVTQAMLKGLGYQVLTASNGLIALDVYDRHRDQIAVVITDLTMPNMGGLALAEALQAKNREIKILAMTGYPLKIGTGALRASGISGWLQKPLSLEQLAKKLDQILKM